MTFVPSPKLDILSTIFSERLLNSSSALDVTSSILNSSSTPSGGSTSVVSATTPLSITTRFEAFSCKKISSSKFAAAAQNVPSFNSVSASTANQQRNSTASTASGDSTRYSTGSNNKNAFLNLSASPAQNNNNSKTATKGDEDDSQGMYDEADLLAGGGGSYSASFSLDQQESSNNNQQKNTNQQSSSNNNQQQQQPMTPDTLGEVERLIPITAAVMDAKYTLDGYSFDGILTPGEIKMMSPEDWFKLICALSVHSTAGVSFVSGGALTAGSGKSIMNLSPGEASSASSSQPSSQDSQQQVRAGGSASSSKGYGFPSSSTFSSSSANDSTGIDSKKLWKNISDILTGSYEEISGFSNATNKTSPNSTTSSQFPFASGAAGDMSLASPSPGSIDAAAAESKHQQQQAKAATEQQPQKEVLPLNHPSLLFFRLNAPDLDPQRKLGGISLRSQSATPAGTPVGILAGSGSKIQFPTSAPSNSQKASMVSFPSNPLENNNSNAATSGTRRDREGDNNNNEMQFPPPNSANQQQSVSLPQSPTSQNPTGVATENQDVTLSEHLFVYHKKTKMCVAIMTCGK